jgi:hypothetical protein
MQHISSLKNPSALGRYWGSADRAHLTTHREGDATIRYEWNDGACIVIDHPTSEDARAELERMGFKVNPEQ